MNVLILAGGKGTRLRPFTSVIPKPLLPVGNQSILEIILLQLQQSGCKHVVLSLGYLSHLFRALLGDGKSFGLDISYIVEDKPLGTAGAITRALPLLGDNFMVMNGDILTTLNFGSLIASHRSKNADATIAVDRRQVNIDFGIVESNKNNEMTSFIEKPTYEYQVSMGINLLKASAVRPILKDGVKMDMPDLLKQLQTTGHKVNCFTQPCYWLDIGRPDDFQTAQEVFHDRRAEFLPNESTLKAA